MPRLSQRSRDSPTTSMTGVVSRCTKPNLGMIVVAAVAAVVATAVVMEEVAVGRMGFNGSPFLIDSESVPRVVSLSFRNSISVRHRADAQVISDRETGRSKGFGFVEMDTDAQAQAAIQGLHDQDHDGRRLTVDEAKPRVARTAGFAGGRIDGSGRNGGGNGYGGDGRQH